MLQNRMQIKLAWIEQVIIWTKNAFYMFIIATVNKVVEDKICLSVQPCSSNLMHKLHSIYKYTQLCILRNKANGQRKTSFWNLTFHVHIKDNFCVAYVILNLKLLFKYC